MEEVAIPPKVLEVILSSISEDAILVGGQALSVWSSYYDIHYSDHVFVGAISDDADFLGSRSDIRSIASGTKGKSHFTPQHMISALVGQVTIPLNSDEFVNVDVLHSIIGIDAEEVRQRASKFTYKSQVSEKEYTFFIMHPLDVLKSRVENLAQLREKQNVEGIEQVRIAIAVASAFIKEVALNSAQESVLKQIETVAGIANSTGGKKVRKEFGVSFIEAIPIEVVTNQNFINIRWQRMQQELSSLLVVDPIPALDMNDPEVNSLKEFAANEELILQSINTVNGQYRGNILSLTENHVLQTIGMNRAVIHQTTSWDTKPVTGQALIVRYKDRQAHLEFKGKSQGLER